LFSKNKQYERPRYEHGLWDIKCPMTPKISEFPLLYLSIICRAGPANKQSKHVIREPWANWTLPRLFHSHTAASFSSEPLFDTLPRTNQKSWAFNALQQFYRF
jgi:hypothetical protein